MHKRKENTGSRQNDRMVLAEWQSRAEQQSSTAAEQQNSRAAEQQNSRAAQRSKSAEQQSRARAGQRGIMNV